MQCDLCGKNPATVHLTEIIDNQMTELHLCEVCAKEKSEQMDQQFGLSDLLAGMVDVEKTAIPAKEPGGVGLKCKNCGLTYNDFKEIGRLGCGECYVTFKQYLGPLLKRIHGSGTHVGKSILKEAAKEAPKASIKKKTAVPVSLEDLRQALAQAIKQEAFEEAAKIRDQIKQLENK